MFLTVAIACKLFLFSKGDMDIEPVLRYKDSSGIDTVTVEISSRRVDLATVGRSVLNVNNSDNGRSLAAALQREGVYLKSYGVSGSATISRRGADPTQTQVLWNNLPICNPMLGMGDFTVLMPIGMSVKLVEGGNATLLGSGSVGGSVSLTNDALNSSQRNYNQGFVSVNSGSFGEYGMSVSLVTPSAQKQKYLEQLSRGATSKLSASATISYNRIGNNFHFADPGLMLERRSMTGAQVDHKLARTSVQYRGAKTQWIWHAEWVEVQRGLGIMMNSYNSLGSQTDRAVRTMMETNTTISKKWKATHRLGWIRDFMNYRDGHTVIGPPQPQISIAATTHLQTEWYYRPKANTLLLIGGDFQSQHADISHYIVPVNRSLPAVFVAWHTLGTATFLKNTWSWQRVVTARFEAKEKIPTASLSWVVKPIQSVAQVKFNIHSTFRRPTLNDLYWYVPGNRPKLTFEQGVGSELAWQRKWTKYGSLEWLVYGRYLDKPIVWVPAGALWMPVNLQGGGLYYGGQSKTKAYLWIHPTHGNLIWINQWERSISWVKSNPQATAYHQIFIPNLAGRSSLVWQKNRLTAELAYAYTGKRFIQTDNKEYLPGFGLVQAEINYQKTIQNKVVIFRLEGDNLFNVHYQTVPNRPMPGASVRFTTTIRF